MVTRFARVVKVDVTTEKSLMNSGRQKRPVEEVLECSTTDERIVVVPSNMGMRGILWTIEQIPTIPLPLMVVIRGRLALSKDEVRDGFLASLGRALPKAE